MNYPLITIITPSFNQAKFIEQTILSVINQDYPKLEYIIIDGGSTDGTVDIIRKYEKHLAYWISEKDNGQSAAINKGLKNATGEIVNWLNSDDYYEKDALSKVANGFAKPDINVVSGRGRLFRESGTVGYTKGVDVYNSNLAKTIGWVRMDQPETFFRKEVFDEIGFLDERLHYLMDRDMWLKYLLVFGLNGIHMVEDVLVNFRLHGDSKTGSRKENFETDHRSLFYSLAKQFGFLDIAEFIKGIDSLHPDFKMDVRSNASTEVIRQAFSYYFLLRANIYYEQKNKSRAEIFYNNVNESDLEEPDAKLYRQMKFRNKLPVSLISLLRKFTRHSSPSDRRFIVA